MENGTTFVGLAIKLLCSDPQVLLAYDAQQALALTRHLGGAVTVVDLDATGAGGLRLIRELRKTFPDLPVVAVSSVLGVP